MKLSQNQHQGGSSSGQTGTAHHGTGGHSRTATQHEHHGYRHSRDGVESQPHGQRSKSTSHNHQQAYHSRENGHSSATGQHESMSQHGRSSHQPRSHSQVKGPSTSQSNATRDNHHQTTQPASSGQNANNSSGTAAARSTTHTSSNANAVGHYILGKALGEGTFGKVKLGTHVLTGEKVAVKVLEKSKIKDKKDVERISREIKILKQLHHPNVVQIYEIIETDKDLYLVMEFASGGELFELIVQNQKLKERTASKHLQELLAGVHYIHQLGICHRDLKPENLLLDFDGQLKIVDFGLSNMYEKNQTLKTACGSPCYAAPEMIAGNRYHGLKSDIWSCGVVLYAMLCGYLPFEDQKTSNLYKKIMNAEYQLPKFLSTDAKDILSKIFVTDPNKRIDIDGLKQHPWYKLYQPENQNYGYHTQTRSVNDKLVMKMEASLGFSIDSVQRAVENNKHNHLSATYYLLLKKYAQVSYKSNQAARCSSVPSRVDTRNSDYQAAKRSNHNKTTVQNTSNSDTKNRQGQVSNENQTSSSGKSAPSSSSASAANNKYNKFRSKPENDRLKAPVQDQLVLKNHRREQSANATAGRHNRNNEWGSVEDERRTESYGRPAPASDEYEIVISKVNKPTTAATQAEEKKNVDGLRDSQNFNQNMRAHFASPSPDIGPNGTRGGNNRHNSSSNQGKQGSNQAPGIQKLNATEAKTKPMEVVNIQNLKQQYNQTGNSSASQTHGRTSSVVKQALPKPATYTQSTVTSSQRGNEKQKQAQKQQNQAERQSTQPQPTSSQLNSSVHRKTKSIAPEIYKQNSEQNPSTQNRDSLNRTLIDTGYIEDNAKFSQTQKIQNLSKSSGQQPRQQSISVSGNGPPTNQTAKVSDLISNLNMMSQQKTYFDQITGKSSSQAAQTNNSTGTNNLSKTGGYIPSKQSSAEQAAGIEGSNVSQGDTVVNVNKNGGGASSGIFQSLTSVVQRPIIQDMNSQNLLKRLESGNSDNALRQNFVNRQSQQSNKRSNEHQGTKGDKRNNKSSPSRKDENGKRSNLQVENPKSQLSNISQPNNNFGGKPISKTPVTGYQTLDTMGDMSSHELKIPVNPDTDRGVSKSIFYGTQKMANLNHEIQRFSNDKISGISTNQVRDFSKTQAVRTSSGYHSRSNTGQLKERSTKNVTQRAESQNRPQSGASQTKYAHTSKHSRQSTSTAMSVGNNNKRHDNTSNENLNNTQTHLSSHQRQSNNGYNIPTQAQTQPTVSNTNAYSTVKNSSQKFQSLKVNSAVKVSAHIVPSQTIEAQTMSSKQGISGNYAQLLQQTVSNNAAKKSQAVHKTRSQSVSAAQKGTNMYTPASHRKGNSSNQTNNLLMSQANAGASATLTAHYRCSTASSTNKERRSSQPPQQNQNNLGPQAAQQSMSIQAGSIQNPHQSKQRSASSTNYQSAFLVKSLDGSRPDTLAATQRTRQKSTRDSNINSSFIQQIPQDRQFQSITHTGGSGANTSILSAPVDETVFNQSFNGGHYSNTQHANSSTYTKRRQQVSNINELLSVAETLRHNSNGYQVRTRASNNGAANQMKNSQNDIRQLQSNNYMLSSQHQNLLLSQTQKTGSGQHKQTNKPIIVDLGPSQQPASATIQNELKASLLLNHSQQQNQATQNRGASQATKQQDLTTAMKQITDGLLQRQQNPSQQQPSHVQPAYQSHQNQSYLSDMFSKQQQQSQQNNQTNQLFKKNPAKNVAGVNLATNLYTQTQQVNLKSGIYSPTSNSRSKPQSYNNTIDVHHPQQQTQPDSTSFSAYQHRSSQQYANSQQSAANGKKQQSSTIDHSSGQPVQQNHSVPSYGVHPQNHQQIQQIQQQHQSNNGQQPGYSGYYPQQYYQAVQQQQSHGNYPSAIVGKDMMNNVSTQQQQQPATFNLLQHHQNTIQQLSGSYQGSASTNPMGNNFMPPQQLAVNVHHNSHNNYSNSHHPHQYQSVPQPQKPPSVPAPSTAYQQMLQQQQHQSNNGMNFYPSQGGSNSQQQYN